MSSLTGHFWGIDACGLRLFPGMCLCLTVGASFDKKALKWYKEAEGTARFSVSGSGFIALLRATTRKTLKPEDAGFLRPSFLVLDQC